MTQQQSPWLEGAYGWNFGEGGWNTGMDQNLLKFSFMFDRNVDSIVAYLPPAVSGQAYFLTTDNRLYFAVGTTYFSCPTPKWFEFVVRATGVTYQFNGISAVQVESLIGIDGRLDSVELSIASLGTASSKDVDFFASTSRVDVVEANAQSTTDRAVQVVGDYAADLVLSNRNQGFRYLGDIYLPGDGIYLPYTTTGIGAAEIATFRSVGDAILRSELDLRYKNIFYPQTYGAVGDAVTDDTAAFNALRDALIANNGGYVVLDRSYNIPAGLNWTISNLTLDGLGLGVILSAAAGTNNAIHITNSANVTIRDLQVVVPRANLRTDGFCILFDESFNIIVSRVKTDGGTVGVWTVNCVNVLVEGCYIDTPKADGVHFGHGSKRCKAIGNTVINSGDDAFSTTFYAGYSRPTDIVFANNIVRGTIWGGGVAVYSADRAVVSGNNISNTALFGVALTEHMGGGKPIDCIVVGNQIHGACQAEKQPDSYWFGTDPGLDPLVTSELHKSAIVVEGTDVSVKNNSISAVNSLPNGLRRRGMMINGTTRAAITGNTFNDINGDGISTTASLNERLSISGNNFESVLGVAIRCTSQIAISLAICNNVGGYGATLSGEPYLVYVQNAGAVLALIVNNTSSGGRGNFVDGSSTNITVYGNIAGAQTWQAFTPTVSASTGTITTATATGWFTIVGKTVQVKIKVNITTNGTGAAGIVVGGLPAGAAAGRLGAILNGRESGITGYSLTGVINPSTTTAIVRTYNNAYPGGDGTILELSGSYEAA